MIDRYSAGAGLAAGIIYGLLYFAYEVTQGWEVPAAVAVALGLLVVAVAVVATEVMVRSLVAATSKEV